MSNLFMESFLLWLAIGTFAFISCYAIAVGTGKRACLLVGIGAALATYAVGAVLVFYVHTDPKAIRNTVFTLEKLLEANDAEGMQKYVASNAYATRNLITGTLKAYKVSGAKVSSFKIEEINKTTSPPRAIVSFRGSITVSGTGADKYSSTALGKLQVELRQEQDGVWRVTDKVKIDLGY